MHQHPSLTIADVQSDFEKMTSVFRNAQDAILSRLPPGRQMTVLLTEALVGSERFQRDVPRHNLRFDFDFERTKALYGAAQDLHQTLPVDEHTQNLVTRLLSDSVRMKIAGQDMPYNSPYVLESVFDLIDTLANTEVADFLSRLEGIKARDYPESMLSRLLRQASRLSRKYQDLAEQITSLTGHQEKTSNALGPRDDALRPLTMDQSYYDDCVRRVNRSFSYGSNIDYCKRNSWFYDKSYCVEQQSGSQKNDAMARCRQSAIDLTTKKDTSKP